MIDRWNGLPLDSIIPNISTFFQTKKVTLSDGSTLSVLYNPFKTTIEKGLTYADTLLQFNAMLSGCIYYDVIGCLNFKPNETDLLDVNKEIIHNFEIGNCEMWGKSGEYHFTEVFNDIYCVGATNNGYI